MKLPEKIKDKLCSLPDKPGCYMMRDKSGRIIYIGKASSLRKRVISYFREATLRRGSPKLRGLVRSIADIDYLVVRNEAEAALTEGRLIKEYRPRYNISFKDDKRFPLLKAYPGNQFPKFELCRIQRDDGAVYFGPYASSASARVALDFIEKTFGIRKCAPRIPDVNTYKHCLNDIIRYCSAPCAGRISQEKYLERFNEACSFLRGERPEYLKQVRERMKKASEELRFEDAAAIRDTFRLLEAAVRRSNRVAGAPGIRREDAMAGMLELENILSLEGPPRVMEAYDVSNISGTYAVASMVCFVDGMPRKNRYRRFRIKTIENIDDPRMIEEVVRRRFRRLQEEKKTKPDLLVIDGGKTQLSAASRALENMDSGNVAMIGLAKRFEEIYTVNRRHPLRLPIDSKALKVLKRIRDEAHRFALDYHHRLRSRRIRESVLDDISGVGPGRKQKLLKHFGSVKKLMVADEDEIAAIPGIGRNLARIISVELAALTGGRSG